MPTNMPHLTSVTLEQANLSIDSLKGVAAIYEDVPEVKSTGTVESWEMLCLDDTKGIIPLDDSLQDNVDPRRDSGTSNETNYTTAPKCKTKPLRIVTRKRTTSNSTLDWLEEPASLSCPSPRPSSAALYSPTYPQPPSLSARIGRDRQGDIGMRVYYYPLWPRSPLVGSPQISTPPHIGEALEQPGCEADGMGMLHMMRPKSAK